MATTHGDYWGKNARSLVPMSGSPISKSKAHGSHHARKAVHFVQSVTLRHGPEFSVEETNMNPLLVKEPLYTCYNHIEVTFVKTIQ